MLNGGEVPQESLLESLGWHRLTGRRMNAGLPLGAGVGAVEWGIPSIYRSIEASRDARTRPFTYFGQGIVADTLAIAGTVLFSQHAIIPDITHIGALHLAQNILTFYAEKAFINNAVLLADWSIRKRRIRR